MVKEFFYFFLFFFLTISTTYGLTLKDAIDIAKKNYPKLKSEKKKLRSKEYLYRSKIFNFFPTVSYIFNYTRYNDINPVDYFSRTHSINLNWIVFNRGINIIQYNLGKTEYLYQKSNFDEEIVNLVYKVKKAYFLATSKKEVLRYRKIQLQAALTDYNVALQRFKLGLVTKSDILNAKVRYENTRYIYIQSKADYLVALANLNSLLGLPLDKETDVDEGELYRYSYKKLNSFNSIYEQFLKNRPIIKTLKYKQRLATLEREQNLYSYTPQVSVFFQQNKSYSSTFGKDNYNFYGIRLEWQIFDGLGRYYRYISSKYNEISIKYEVKETLRKLKLNLYQKYVKYKLNLEKVQLAEKILKQAEENYKQTLGEYKVGKNDIVTLINSESSLADAQINLINSILDLVLTKVEIEKEIGKIY